MNDFWNLDEPVLPPWFSNLLTDYANIPPEDHTRHVQAIRQKAWQVRQYPCLASYMFVELSMRQHPAYATTLASLKSDQHKKLLDLGCCIGQDLRQLAHDGVPGKQLVGYDIEHAFFDVGYEAFCDRRQLSASFISGDFLADNQESEGSIAGQGEYDFIHAADFFHLWSWTKQLQTYTRALLLLKDGRGCVLFGRNTGVEKARLLDEGPFGRVDDHGEYTWLHDIGSMRLLIEEAAVKAGRECDVMVEETRVVDERILKVKAVDDLGWNRRLSFTICTSQIDTTSALLLNLLSSTPVAEMGSYGPPEEDVHGIVRFTIPDNSVSAQDRAIFTLPGNKSLKDEKVKLHDFHASQDVLQGPRGLDNQGFTYIRHKSQLKYDDWLQGTNVEDIYVQELKDLILEVTGAKEAVVYCVAFRRRPATEQGIEKVEMKGGEMDSFVGCLPRDKILISGRDAYSTEPSRQVHIDISPQGLFDTLKSCRKDISKAAEAVIEAAEKGAEIPRYGAFSVWRPLKAVKRDPMAVCDSRTNDKCELVPVDFRALSEMNDSAEYSMQALMGIPPKKPEKQRWYWMPEQTEEDVLIIKFADSAAVDGGAIAGGCLHTSPIIEGTGHEEVRESVEARIYVFW